jgi:hypothetical protein
MVYMDESDRVVRHEKPDYAYAPEGLMAEPWGKQGHRTQVAEFLQEAHLRDRRIMDNDSSRDASEYIWSLDDATVLAARIAFSPEHEEICRRLAPVNPYWVTARAGCTAYDRDLIDEHEIDRIMNEV